MKQPLWIFVATLVAVVVACRAVSADGQPVDVRQPAPAQRGLAFSPDTPDRCKWFFITESNVSFVPMDASSPFDKLLIDDSCGLMKNVGSRDAVGASMDLILAQDFHFAPTLRYKRWFGAHSVDLMLGYIPGETEGPTGPILTARYSPARLFQIQIGGCRYRQTTYQYIDPSGWTEERTPLQFFLGIGFGGAAGTALWGVQAILVGAAASAYGGL